jgi:hypothetical protein
MTDTLVTDKEAETELESFNLRSQPGKWAWPSLETAPRAGIMDDISKIIQLLLDTLTIKTVQL